MPRRAARVRSEAPVEQLIAGLTVDELREVVAAAVDRHADVERQVRLIAARGAGDLAQLRAEVDRGLRTRRFLDYGESAGWARAAQPIIAELEKAVEASPSRALVELLQRAVGHVVKVIMHADDSDGLIGDLARELLALHARACDAGVADPVELAAWMVRFGFDDQDFFEVDPVRYASALGEVGLAAYRDAVGARRDGDSFAVRYARERLAILDRDVDALVKLLGGDLTTPYQFIRVAEAMRELGLDDEALAWAKRGIAQTSGWQVSQLYDLACDVHDARGEPLEVLALRRAQHERMPSSSTYRALRTAAEALDAWPLEQDAARATLQRTDAARVRRRAPRRRRGRARVERGRRGSAGRARVRSVAAARGEQRARPARRRARGLPADRRRGARAEPTGARTARPHGSSSARERRRRPPASSTRSPSTSRACASGTGDGRR